MSDKDFGERIVRIEEKLDALTVQFGDLKNLLNPKVEKYERIAIEFNVMKIIVGFIGLSFLGLIITAIWTKIWK